MHTETEVPASDQSLTFEPDESHPRGVASELQLPGTLLDSRESPHVEVHISMMTFGQRDALVLDNSDDASILD